MTYDALHCPLEYMVIRVCTLLYYLQGAHKQKQNYSHEDGVGSCQGKNIPLILPLAHLG